MKSSNGRALSFKNFIESFKGLSQKQIPQSTEKDAPSISSLNGSKLAITDSKYIGTPDRFRFHTAFQSYCHHGSTPLVTSLMDLADSSSSVSLLPRRRLYGNPFETLSIKSGDDSMIISPNLVGVADGVSGYSGSHSDSGLFARSLLENISRYLTELSVKSSRNLSLITDGEFEKSLDSSFEDALKIMDLENLKGSSTLLIAMIIDADLKILNIGDSKIFIIRNKEIVYSNQEQYISKLCPEQIGTNNFSKFPSTIVKIDTFKLKEEDLILIASDGLTDNLYPDEILEFLNSNLNDQKNNLQKVINKLLYKTKSIAFDSYCVTPYVEKINELNKEFITGGKLDDISVSLSKVSINYRN
ncbi:hypothetical protein WICMUC_004612 [Wickerhamomyces mucosus]|uniref:Protein phosphatase n=1 Tax=Wickerhamomyces mucosus TaxID=1378264 RepID=A0A9P8PG51_9ASCO|nr:hypothetical protein WICMUC_004612 [Wickerhamomyces mucosus]